jgi:hypothetical protein
VRRVPLVNPGGNAVETVAQAVAELSRLRTRRADDSLSVLGRTSVREICPALNTKNLNLRTENTDLIWLSRCWLII